MASSLTNLFLTNCVAKLITKPHLHNNSNDILNSYLTITICVNYIQCNWNWHNTNILFKMATQNLKSEPNDQSNYYKDKWPTTMSFSIFWRTNFKKFQTFSFVKCSHNQSSVVQFMSNHLTNIYLSFEHQFLDPRSTISTHLGESLRAFGFEFRIRGKSIAHSTLTSWDTKKQYTFTCIFSHFLAGNIS